MAHTGLWWLLASRVPGLLMAAAPEVRLSRPVITLAGLPAPSPSSAVGGFVLLAHDTGPQMAVTERPATCVVSLAGREDAHIAIPIHGITGEVSIAAAVTLNASGPAQVALSLNGNRAERVAEPNSRMALAATATAAGTNCVLQLSTAAQGIPVAVRWENVRVTWNGGELALSLYPGGGDVNACPPRVLPPLRPPIEAALIEWDWRLQDGLGTERMPSTYAEAVARTLQRGDALIQDLLIAGVELKEKQHRWQALRRQFSQLADPSRTEAFSGETVARPPTSPSPHPPENSKDSPNWISSLNALNSLGDSWEDLWRAVHRLRREIVFANPLTRTGPLALIKQVPGMFSHQLTQYYGSCARPGGGVFVLESPGQSMQCRELAAGALPAGSYQHLEVSSDGHRLLFSYCPAPTVPKNREEHLDRFYHLYTVKADGSGLKQLTDGPYDDFSPRYLPDGKILFVSTRRGGFHRCGRGPCSVYTLTVAEADGSNPRPISYHETHEWDPAVLPDGRILYTRWDYVDRHAVYYEQLWSVRPDGSDVRAFYGNNTFNPVGTWEAQPVPGSGKIMATAAAHHAMTAGSIILLDPTRGLEGLAPITRLTPDALFPESEAPVSQGATGFWTATAGVKQPPAAPPEAVRWPGHCYRTPLPLSEKYFFAAYSFDALIGEPTWNRANMFGLYLVDAFGNKELVYRDLNIASQWPRLLRPRPQPVQVAEVPDAGLKNEGTFFVQNVYASWPALPREPITRLRIVQVLPKSTPHANDPPVGLPHASPGKQVLGTVPVELDGSAYFRAPAGIPLAFQALDARGQAVQMMRSLTYLQPGERASCIGCHEPRDSAPPMSGAPRALQRPPSPITPGPEGANPLSYPLLVQPVLDRKCVQCHNPARPDGNVLLTGERQGRYTISYHALAPRVPYSDWAGRPGDFRVINREPLTPPDFFGARGCQLMKDLLAGHEGVTLEPDEIERLATWMDANVLFYGTFDPQDQARQQAGERIAGPAIQ